MLERIRVAQQQEAQRAAVELATDLWLRVIPAAGDGPMVVPVFTVRSGSGGTWEGGEPPNGTGPPEILDTTSSEAGIDVLWTYDGTNQNGFTLQVNPSDTGWVDVDNTDGATYHLVFPTSTGGVPYKFRVRAWKGSLSIASDWSAEAGPVYWTYEP